MEDLLLEYERKPPIIVFNWRDNETEAEGRLVINSLRGRAAGGGTRMRVGLDLNEVLSLAKTMEVKFTVSGPQIGGAKSGINFDPKDPRKKGVLERWFRAIAPLLKGYYGTGGDLNVAEIDEVIPLISGMGILHPQEGIVNAHYDSSKENRNLCLDQLKYGVVMTLQDKMFCPTIDKPYKLADMITGYGVVEAIKHYYDIFGGSYKNKKAVVQGFGNVGAAATFYLTRIGVKVIAIIDKNGGVINESGFTEDDVITFMSNKTGNTLDTRKYSFLSFKEINKCVWDLRNEIFVPCATSRLITMEQLRRMLDSGLELISPGANVPFADQRTFFGPTMEYADDNLSLIPDFIANCGMARTFNYLMKGRVDLNEESIFWDTSNTIKNAIQEIYHRCPEKKGISRTAIKIALEKLKES